ncbi:vanadium-dependent haloperoxidase [Algicella marina]|uniref:Phosphatase PAP2 family protein n=1 Tax=Algicella marina TaxID=2683284 RepID=A0A6P1T313_9RHOB|nr:vanadium-dependent haloperoxidase [Algicella marina]QHQ37118.1 phosphatase PAP2 family protein [Algicella marina]
MPAPEIVVDPDTAGVSIVDPDPSISVIWDQAVQAAVIEAATGPTVASRAYAVTHAAMFEAWAAYDPVAIGTAFGDALQQDVGSITDVNKAEAMSYAAYVALVDLFPEQVERFDALMDDLGYTSDTAAVNSDAGLLGIQAGEGVVARFAGDGSNQAGGYADTSGYEPENANRDNVADIAHWTPEFVPAGSSDPDSVQTFLTPHWQDVTPFALDASDQFRPPEPEPFFLDTWQASLDMDAGTITIFGLGEDTSIRDVRMFRRFLLNEYDCDISRGEVNRFTKEAIRAINGEGRADPDNLRRALTLDVSSDLIGEVINPGFIEQAEYVVGESAALTDETKVVAEFWEDGGGTSFPPGTWMTFAEYVSARDDNTLDEDAQLFFMMSNAVFDAGIATWESKVYYDYARPVAVISDLGELGLIGEWGTDYLGNEGYVIDAYAGPGLGTQTILAADFITYQRPGAGYSPPFAEYTSGHSSFSAAGAEILSLFTGSDYFGAAIDIDFLMFDGVDDLDLTVTLAWDTFSDAALSSGMSRIYGGIHFSDGNENGLDLGAAVGATVYETALGFINGTAEDFFFV